MHRNHQARADSADQANGVRVLQSPPAVDGNEEDVDPAESRQGLPLQGVIQVAQVGGAESRGLDDEDGVGVRVESARLDEVRGDVEYARVLHPHVHLGDPPPGVPPAQDQGEVGGLGAVRVMRVAHRHGVGPDRRKVPGVVIGEDRSPARRFDQEARMAAEGDSQMTRGNLQCRGGPPPNPEAWVQSAAFGDIQGAGPPCGLRDENQGENSAEPGPPFQSSFEPFGRSHNPPQALRPPASFRIEIIHRSAPPQRS